MIGTTALIASIGLIASQSSCGAGTDGDGDGLSDACEIEIARAFAPVLVISPAACNFDAALDRLGGAYLFGVQPIESGLRIVYLPAYLQDCGWSGPKCLLRLRGGCNPHIGDSEFIAVDLVEGPPVGVWHVERVFLSAHCFGRGNDCTWHAPNAFTWFESKPFVWVAEGKNGNYPSRSACDSGHWHFDTCNRNDRSVQFPILSSAQNIGSKRVPFPAHPQDLGCLASHALPSLHLPVTDHLECIWTDSVFRGWRADGSGSTGYRRYLAEIAAFDGS